jgi:hypothetical protein
MRPTALILIPAWGFFSIWRFKRRFIYYAIGIAVGLIPMIAYHLYYFGTLLGGYFQHIENSGFMGQANPLLNFLNYLFTPSRGLLVFCPFVLLSVFSCRKPCRKLIGMEHEFWIYIISCILIFGILLPYKVWWGGFTYGPRLMADIMPFLILLCLPGAVCLARINQRFHLGYVILGLLTTWSIGLQMLGAFRYDAQWDSRVDIDQHPESAWSILNSTIAFCLSGRIQDGKELLAPSSYLLPSGRMMPLNSNQNRQLIYSGFYPPEGWGIWSEGVMNPELLIHVPDPSGTLKFTLVAGGSTVAPARIDFYLNGFYLGRALISENSSLSWKPRLVEMHVKPGILTGEIEKLRIVCLDPFMPSARGENFGFGLFSLGWFGD